MGITTAKGFFGVASILTNPRALQVQAERGYLEGQGDLVSRLITPINHIVTLVITIINPLT